MEFVQFYKLYKNEFGSSSLEKPSQNTISHPTLNTSASLSRDELMRIGNGYFSNSLGNLTIASHCSPTRPDRRPTTETVGKWTQKVRTITST